MRSHSLSELWSICAHPTRAEVFTFDRSGLLAVWSLAQKRQTKNKQMQCGGDAIAISEETGLLVLGYSNGQFIVLDNNLEAVIKKQNGPTPISVLKFSPDGNVLAVGA